MRMKRRGKINRVNPVDFGLEELSKINKEDVVRVMDRSKERSGEKISDESGLYVPKRELYDVLKISSSTDEHVPKRKVLSNAEREDYNYGKTFAVGEQYLDNERYKFSNYNENYSYDDFEDTDDFSIEDFFENREFDNTSDIDLDYGYAGEDVRVVDADAPAESYGNIQYRNVEEDGYAQSQESNYVTEGVYYEDSADVPEGVASQNGAKESERVALQNGAEESERVALQNGAKESERVALQNGADVPEGVASQNGVNESESATPQEASSIPGYTFRDSKDMADVFENAYLGIDQATMLRELARQNRNEEVPGNAEADDSAQYAAQSGTSGNAEADNKAEDSGKSDNTENSEKAVDTHREQQLHEVMERIQAAATPKEKLALEREAVRLGMSEVLSEYDGSDMVRPELLEEIGFTPGGEKEPEIVKNKRFRFGRKKKEKNQNKAAAEIEKNKKDNIQKETYEKDKTQKESDKVQNDTDKQSSKGSKSESTAQKQASNSENKRRTTIAEKHIINNKNKVPGAQGKPAMNKERRSEVMHDPQKRRNYILKNKKRLEKASEDLMKMQEKYDNLTKCINDMVLLDNLPEDVEKNIKHTAGMVVKYRHETDKTKENIDMDKAVYRRIDQDKDELPEVIKRLVENEKYSDRLYRDINSLENEKKECQDISEDNTHRQKITRNISVAVIIFTVITMVALIIVQVVSEYDMQIAILIFGACAVLETLGIFVQHFKTETDETINYHKLNKTIKKQNAQKLKYVNAVNAVDYVYKKYNVHSSSELLFQWETYQRVSQAREDYKIAGNEVLYYEERLFNILNEYGFDNPQVWVSQAEYIVEDKQLSNVKKEMTEKRTKLMVRMDKCKKVIGKLDSELSVLVIKFPQYADEIKRLLREV